MNDIIIDKSWYTLDPSLPERISAGGVIVREDHGSPFIALARENDFPQFVLPKGGVKKGETIEQAARREILEEAGLYSLSLVRYLGIRERLSFDKSRRLVVHYFLFTTRQVTGQPTDSDRHHGVWWFPLDTLPRMLWREQVDLVLSLRDEIYQLFTRPGS